MVNGLQGFETTDEITMKLKHIVQAVRAEAGGKTTQANRANHWMPETA